MDFTVKFILGITLVILATCPLESTCLKQQLEDNNEFPYSTKNETKPIEKTLREDDEFKKVDEKKLYKISDNRTKFIKQESLVDDSKPKTDLKSSTNLDATNNKIIPDDVVNDLMKANASDIVKLEKSEPYKKSTDFERIERINKKLKESESAIHKNVVKLREPTKSIENNTESSPSTKDDNSSRPPIDMDITKYVSEEFHNINNVYTLPTSPDTEKYVNYEYLHQSSSFEEPDYIKSSEYSVELTTPKHLSFDARYKEAQESFRQRFDNIDTDFNVSNESKEPPDVDIDKLIENTKSNDTDAELSFIRYNKILNNDTKAKNFLHQDLEVEEVRNINFQSSYNETEIFDDHPIDDDNNQIEKDNNKLVGNPEPAQNDKINQLVETDDEEKNEGNKTETTTPKSIPMSTTRKNLILTKPTPNRNNSRHISILSNKIETETLKATEPVPLQSIILSISTTTKSSKTTKELVQSTTSPISTTTEESKTTKKSIQSTTSPISTTTEESKTTKESIQSITSPISATTEESKTTKELASNIITKRPLIDITKRGSIKYSDPTKPVTSTVSTTTTITYRTRDKALDKEKFNKTTEQLFQENQIVPIHVKAPDRTDDTSTEKPLITSRSFAPTDNYRETSTIKQEASTQTMQSLVDSSTTPSESQTITESVTHSTPKQSPYKATTLESIAYSTIEYVTQLTPKEFDETTFQVFHSSTEESLPVTSTTDQTMTATSTNNDATTTIDTNVDTTLTTFSPEITTTIAPETSTRDVSFVETTTTFYDDTTSYSTTTKSQLTTTEIPFITTSSTEIEEVDFTTESIVSELMETTTNIIVKPITESDGRTSKGIVFNKNLTATTENSNQVIRSNSSSSSHLDIVATTPAILRTTSSHSSTSTVSTTNSNVDEIINDYEDADDIGDEEDTNKSGLFPTTEFMHVEKINYTTLSPKIDKSGRSRPSSEVDKSVERDNDIQKNTLDDINTTQTTSKSDELVNNNPEDNSGTIAAIAISCVGAVCLVILAGLLFVMRKRQKRFNYGQRCTPVSLDDYSMDNVSVYNSVRRKGVLRTSKRSYGNPAFEDPTSVSHPLNFPALGKFANNTEDIKAEFEEIPQISARTNELPDGCDTKNRYANVIPLPETRVPLNLIDGYPNSDYINANYVTGPRNVKGYYIACQAPLQNTVDDFWRMVWEQQSKVILMLTHLFENGIEKSVDYLPPSEVLDCHRLFGDYQITLKKREVKDKYIISILQLKNMVSNSWREVTHLWYLGWPDKGVPSEANSLIAFLIEARSYMKNGSPDKKDRNDGGLDNGSAKHGLNPVVVHCSPGTGRTGAVIACDIAIREFEQNRLVDVPRIVYKIRRDRASSVQTRDQYAFIYKVISLYATKLTGGGLDSL